MFAKLTVVILAIGACALSLLAMRQSRIVLAHEIAQAQLRQQKQDEQLLRLRTRIAELITPERVGVFASDLGELKPFVAEHAGAVVDPAKKDSSAATPGVSQPGAKPSDGVIDPRLYHEGTQQMIAKQPRKPAEPAPANPNREP